jgi:type IV pilus assembly protein PilM
MLFNNKSLGLEIFHNGMAFVLAGGSKALPHIDKFDIVRLPEGVIKPSLKDSNLLDVSQLKAALFSCYENLSTKIKRVSVSIPDSAGRVLLVEMEMPVKNKAEGIDHVRWKLKKSFPIDLNEVHLDYQILRQDDAGSASVLVALISREIISEYENLLLEVGLEPSLIDFSSFNLYRIFSSRLDVQDHLTFISLHRGGLLVLIFQDGLLDFTRSKYLGLQALDTARLYREVNSSLVVYSDAKGGWKPRSIFCYASSDERDSLRNVLHEVLGTEPVFMDTDALVNSSHQQLDRKLVPDILCALGAATRSLS